MWYADRHASTPVRPSPDGHRTRRSDRRAPFPRRLHPASLPSALRAPRLASARHEHVPAIAHVLGCNTQTVRNAIHAFNRSGLDALAAGSSRPHRIAVAFDAAAAERLRALLHQSPRTFGKPTSLWTLDLAAEVCADEGIT